MTSRTIFALLTPVSYTHLDVYKRQLQDIAHGGDVDQNLMFAGHAAFNFKTDPFYSNNFTPTVKELVDRILTGD